ncbi:XcyI family restriction endonuclease [Thermoflexus sp.]|uniref:XcyI family restriction endonuclease n=1 Tax=Thermoflexus sp. TaxID=1969742 RepID=UPI002ADE4891|nr:XcyI family restriction endonuclease [Thermoflexus sp.]
MSSQDMGSRQENWFLDQLSKSEFFHSKLHEWKMVEIAESIENLQGEAYDWSDLAGLGITKKAWNRVIHRGIRPVTVFAHPQVLHTIPGAVRYYRMLAMVSQKSMDRVGLPIRSYEEGGRLPEADAANRIAQHLNRIISHLIEFDEKIHPREFDLWRGMAAGAQAQGAWQNQKGAEAEQIIKDKIQSLLRDRGLVASVSEDGSVIHLHDGRRIVFGSDPDIEVCRGEQVLAAVEIKGGIDPAGAWERFGATLKSLERVLSAHPKARAILIIRASSLTPEIKNTLDNSPIEWFAFENLMADEQIMEELVKAMLS